MKKLALAALLAVASTSAPAAVVIRFEGVDSNNAAISGMITIDPGALPVNDAANKGGDVYYYSSDYFMSVVVDGLTIPLSGGVGDNLISSDSGPDGSASFAINSETDSGTPTQNTWSFSLFSDASTQTTGQFGGILLPDLRTAGSLSFELLNSGNQGVILSSRTGSATILSYVDTNAADVPEPSSWAMMIGGLGLVGGVMRRRRTTIAYT